MARTATARASFVAPALATLVDRAPTGPVWLFETKFDGYRMQCHVARDRVTLISRNGLDWTDRFQAIADAARRAFAGVRVVLDGEIVVSERGGRSSFHALQRSLGERDTGTARFMVFDLLALDDDDLRRLPLSGRREVLEALLARSASTLKKSGVIAVSRLLRGPGDAALARACARGEEGIICKRRDAPYESGRSRSWLKVKCGRRQEFVVVGFTEPKGRRSGLGALLLGVYDQRELLYAGRVGTGFSDDELVKLRRLLDARERDASPLSSDASAVREAGRVHWVRPSLVAEVSFTEWTNDGLLRHPVYQGLREDKKASAVKREA